jgi:hypothetical protein
VPAERDRDDGALDRGGLLEAADLDAFEQRGLETERTERDRRRIVVGLRAIGGLRLVRGLEIRP